MPVEFKEGSVVLEINRVTEEIPNDFVWIFAGGEPPTGFLKKIGVEFGMRDVTGEASSEAKIVATMQTLTTSESPTWGRPKSCCGSAWPWNRDQFECLHYYPARAEKGRGE